MTSSSARGPRQQSISGPELRKIPSFENALPTIVLAIGFVARLIPACRLFLNPDEALHNLLASQPTITRAWAAALTNAHPPLLILVLYYWRALGQSELWLRMPSVLAGTAACWLFYRWLKLTIGRTTAFYGLVLMCFAPSLILLSAEVRQYALLLFFMTACLYISELAVQKNSPAWMAVFSLALYGALLTHYSALVFAFSMGVYLLLRLYPFRDRVRLIAVWGAGQIGGAAIAAYFLATHVSRLRQTGMVRADLESYLRKSTYHAGERNPVEFVAAQTLRVFTYVFSHGLVGTLMLLAFLAGVSYLLWRGQKEWQGRETPALTTKKPAPRELALLIGLPLVVSWGMALAGLYPLGATRHSSFLAPFAIAGAAVGIAAVIPAANGSKTLGIVIFLAVCNLFPAPPPAIRAQDQSRVLMRRAVADLRASAPPGTVLLADYESGLLLGYYLCGHGVVQIFPPSEPFVSSGCGPYSVLSPSFQEWKFVADTFPGELASASKMLNSGTQSPAPEIWIFYAGWINDSAPGMKPVLAEFGCPAPRTFGANILLCQLTARGNLRARKRPPSQEGGRDSEESAVSAEVISERPR
jgi:hypothetical protein